MFGSSGRTRSVTRAFTARMCERRDARSLAPSLCSTLEHYLLLLTLCVVHARGQRRSLRPMIGCGRCCRWMLSALSARRCGLPFPYPPVVWPRRQFLSPPPPAPPRMALDPSPVARDSGTARQAGGRRNDNNNNNGDGIDNAIRSSLLCAGHSLSGLPGNAYPARTHRTYVLVTRYHVPTTACGPRHHSDALLLEIRWHISPRQSVVRTKYGLLDEKTYDARINAMNFANERASERTGERGSDDIRCE